MRKIIIIVCLAFIPILCLSQQRGPGNPGGEPTGNDPPIGGGAPIGSGVGILMSISILYLGRKVYKLRNIKEELEEL